MENGGEWYAALPGDEWDTDEEEAKRIQALWHPDFGDRQQELVFIGQHLDQKQITETLNSCLLELAELALGPDHWKQCPDPFSWDQVPESSETAEVPQAALMV